MLFFKWTCLASLAFASKRKGDDLELQVKKQKTDIWEQYPLQPTNNITTFLCSKVTSSFFSPSSSDSLIGKLFDVDDNANLGKVSYLIESFYEDAEWRKHVNLDNADDFQSTMLDPFWSIFFPWHRMKISPLAADLLATGKNLFARLRADYQLIEDQTTRMNINAMAYRLLYSLFMMDENLKNYSQILSEKAIIFLTKYVSFRSEDKSKKFSPAWKKNLSKDLISLSDIFEQNMVAALVIHSYIDYSITSTHSSILTKRNVRFVSLLSELPFWSNLDSHAGLRGNLIDLLMNSDRPWNCIEPFWKTLFDLHFEHSFEVYNLNSNDNLSYTTHPQFLHALTYVSSKRLPILYLTMKFSELYKKAVPIVEENEILGDMSEIIRILPPRFFSVNKIVKLSLENSKALSVEQVCAYDSPSLIMLELDNFSEEVQAHLLNSGEYLLLYLRKYKMTKTKEIVSRFSPDALYECYNSSYEGNHFIAWAKSLGIFINEQLTIFMHNKSPTTWEEMSQFSNSPGALLPLNENAELLRQHFLSLLPQLPQFPLFDWNSLPMIDGSKAEMSRILKIFEFEQLFHDIPLGVWMVFFDLCPVRVSESGAFIRQIPLDLAFRLALDPFFSVIIPWDSMAGSIDLNDLNFAIRLHLSKWRQDNRAVPALVFRSGVLMTEGKLQSLADTPSRKIASAWDFIVHYKLLYSSNPRFSSHGNNPFFDINTFAELTKRELILQPPRIDPFILSYTFAMCASHTGRNLARIQELSSGFSVLWLYLEPYMRLNATSINYLIQNNSDQSMDQRISELLFHGLFRILQNDQRRNGLEAELTRYGMLGFFRRCVRDWLSHNSIPSYLNIFDPAIIPWIRDSRITVESASGADPRIFVGRDMSEIIPVLDDAFFSRNHITIMTPRTIEALNQEQVLLYRSNLLSQINWNHLNAEVRAGLLANTHKMMDIFVTSQVYHADNWNFITAEYCLPIMKKMSPTVFGGLLKNLKAFPDSIQQEILKLASVSKLDVTGAFRSSDNTLPMEAVSLFDNPEFFAALKRKWTVKLMESIAAKVRLVPLPKIMEKIREGALANVDKLKLIFGQEWGRPIFTKEDIFSITVEQFDSISDSFYSWREHKLVPLFQNCKLYFHMMRAEVKPLAAAVLVFVAFKHDVTIEPLDCEVFQTITSEDFDTVIKKTSTSLSFGTATSLNMLHMKPYQVTRIEQHALGSKYPKLLSWLENSTNEGQCLKLSSGFWKKMFKKHPNLFKHISESSNFPSDVLIVAALAHNFYNFPPKVQDEFIKMAKENMIFFLGTMASPTTIDLDTDFWQSLPSNLFEGLEVVFNRGTIDNVNWRSLPISLVNIERYRPFMTKKQSEALTSLDEEKKWAGAFATALHRIGKNK